MKSKLCRITSSGKWQMSLLYFSSPPPSFFPLNPSNNQPTLSSVSLLSAIFPILHFIISPLPQVKLCPPPHSNSSSSTPRQEWGQIIARAPTPGPAPACVRDTASCGQASPSAGTGSHSSVPPGSDHRCWTPAAVERQQTRSCLALWVSTVL